MSDEAAPATARHVVVFSADAVAALLDAAELTGSPVDLAKDDGAYLMTWNGDGRPVPDLIVYADGHTPPPGERVGSAGDDLWPAARQATEEVWGGDDFAETFTVEQLRAALGPTGLRMATTVASYPLPAGQGLGLPGMPDRVYRLTELALLPTE